MEPWRVNINIRNLFRRFIPELKRQPNRLALHYAIADALESELYDDFDKFRTLKKFEANIEGGTFAIEALLNQYFLDVRVRRTTDDMPIYIIEESYPDVYIDLANIDEQGDYPDSYIDLSNESEGTAYVDLVNINEGQSFEDFQVNIPSGVNRGEVKDIVDRFKPATKDYNIITY